jgi:hypothetical protein
MTVPAYAPINEIAGFLLYSCWAGLPRVKGKKGAAT